MGSKAYWDNEVQKHARITNLNKHYGDRSSEKTLALTTIKTSVNIINSLTGKTVIPAKAGIHLSGTAMHKEPAVYILANKTNGTLSIGVTSNLPQRIYQHKNNLVQGFTRKHKIHKLVYFELHENMTAAITREKQIKRWKRDWKIELITTKNPEWDDLYSGIL